MQSRSPAKTDPPPRRHGVRRIASFALVAPLGVYLAAVGVLATQQRAMLFMTDDDGRLASAGGIAIPGSERVTLTASDGVETSAWYVPPQPGKPVFLFLHGQGGRLVVQKGRWQRLRDSGSGVLAVSYRGYPGSAGGPRSGSPSEDGIALDARAAYDWLLARHARSEIVIHGHSLGTGVAVRLAAELGAGAARALVLEAPFTAAVDVAGERIPWVPASLLMWDQFRSRDLIGQVRVPLLIAHGDRDSVIPFGHAVDLHARANEPKRFVRMSGSDHNTLTRDGLYAHVFEFIGRQATVEQSR